MFIKISLYSCCTAWCSCLPVASVLQFHMHSNRKRCLSVDFLVIFPATTHSNVASGWPLTNLHEEVVDFFPFSLSNIMQSWQLNDLSRAFRIQLRTPSLLVESWREAAGALCSQRPAWLRSLPGASSLWRLLHQEESVWLLLGTRCCGMPTSSLCWLLQTCAVWENNCKLLCFFL